MKVTDIKMYTVQIPLLSLEEGGLAPYRGSGDVQAGTVGGTSHALSNLFRVDTDEGITGWGEMNPAVSLDINKRFLEEFIRPNLIGMDPFHIRELHRRLAASYNPQIDVTTFLTGVDIACYDIMGKATGRPVCDLLGGAVRDRVKIAYCLGMLSHHDTREVVKRIVADGFGCIKTKGGIDVEDDICRTRIIREAGGNALELRMDVNCGYDPISALHYLTQVEDCNLQYIEQPLPMARYDDMAMLRSRTRVPLAINEDCYFVENVKMMIRHNAIDALVVDLEQLGGITKLTDLGMYVEHYGIRAAHHCGFDMGIKTAAILHSTCARPSFTYAMDSTYQAHADDILKRRVQIEDGHYLLPCDGPGLGVEVDLEKVEKYAIKDCDRPFI